MAVQCCYCWGDKSFFSFVRPPCFFLFVFSMEKLSSKRRRPCVSGRENRALNTNRNKMEQAKTSNFSLGQLLASCFLKFMIRKEYFSVNSFPALCRRWCSLGGWAHFYQESADAVSTLTFYGNIIPRGAPLGRQQGVDSTRKKKERMWGCSWYCRSGSLR